MARKNKSSKAADKKRDRLALEKLMNHRLQFVKAANEQEDPLQALPSFRVSRRSKLLLRVTRLLNAIYRDTRRRDWT